MNDVIMIVTMYYKQLIATSAYYRVIVKMLDWQEYLVTVATSPVVLR